MGQHDILTTRSLTRLDFEAWLPLWSAYLGQSHARMRWPDRTALFAKLVAGEDNIGAMVVERGGEIIGLAHYQIRHSDFTFENAYFVQDLYIVPEYRESRAGAALVRAIYGHAEQHSIPAVYWPAAENTYRRRHDGQKGAVVSAFVQFRKAA